MARWQAESSAAKPPAVNGALAWIKSIGHSAQNMVSGRLVAFVWGIVFTALFTHSAPNMVSGRWWTWLVRHGHGHGSAPSCGRWAVNGGLCARGPCA